MFTTRLTADDWDEAMHGWRCQVLTVPGAVVQALYVEGNQIDCGRYQVLSDLTFIRWMAPDQPERIAASIKLTEALSLGKDTEKWKRLAIILPVAATIIAASLTSAATYLSRSLDTPTPSPPPIEKSKDPPKHAGWRPGSGGNEIDLINAQRFSFTEAAPIEIGPVYLARFRNDEAPLYFKFRQPEDAHDLTIRFSLTDLDEPDNSTLSIYGARDHVKLFTRWHGHTDSSTVSWKVPVTPGDYILEIAPAGISSNFAQFHLSLSPA